MPRATAKPTTKGCKRYFLIDLVKREMKPSCRMGTTAPEVESRVCTPCVDAELEEEEEGGTATLLYNMHGVPLPRWSVIQRRRCR